jgi:hypothetical protein
MLGTPEALLVDDAVDAGRLHRFSAPSAAPDAKLTCKCGRSASTASAAVK